jgi:hypothetical protein
VFFKIIGKISDVETIASSKGIKQIRRLRKYYGAGNWKKMKGTANAEVRWYEAHGAGTRELKIKKILEIQ